MTPVLLPHVSGYGFAVAMGFVTGVWLAVRRGRRAGLDGGALLDLSFWILLAGVGGSRALFVLLNAERYARLCLGSNTRPLGRVLADCAAPLRLWDGGLVFYGGALCAAAVVAVFCHRRRWSFPRLADVFAPALALGHAFGRMGCFLAGCCYGRPLDGGPRFPPGSVAYEDLRRIGALPPGAEATAGLHPTQLYEAAGELVIFFVLLRLERRKRAPGQVALTYALLYAGLRAVVEIWRGDAGRRFLFELPAGAPLVLSTSQAISVAVALAAGWGLRRLFRRDQANAANGPRASVSNENG